MNINLQPEELIAAAARIRGASQTLLQQSQEMRNFLAGMASHFSGQPAQAFDARLEEWVSATSQHIETLSTLAHFFDQMAQTLADVDAEIASQLG